MKIQICSDLHFEFQPFGIDNNTISVCEEDADYLVIAGDLSSSRELFDSIGLLMKKVNPNKKVIYVPGNHDYYYTSKAELDIQLKEGYKWKNFIPLINGVLELDDIIFLGATGWGDGSHKMISERCFGSLADFFLIKELTVEESEYIKWGNKDRQWFHHQLHKYKDSNKTIICISHNSPSPNSIAKKWKGSPINGCFANNWENMILEYEPTYWIHGHMHNNSEYNIGKTKVICNPYGYARNNENTLNFKTNLVIDIV